MKIDANEHFECIGDKNVSCFILGCIYYNEKSKKFEVCKHLQLKKEFAVFKK